MKIPSQNIEISPQILATKRRKLALEYREKMKELSQIQQKKALDIIPLIEEHNSVAKAERYYATTEDGQKEIELRYVTKGLLELIRSLKSEIDIARGEGFNQY